MIKHHNHSTHQPTVLGCALLMLLATFITSCVTTNFEQIREGSTGLEENESIVILGRRDSLGYEAQASLIGCLTKNTKHIRIISQKEFVDMMFPWFEPRVAPRDLNELKALISQPAIRERIEKANLRYLIWADGSNNNLDSKGTMSCAVSPVGGFCFGFLFWQQDANYEITVWNLNTLTLAGKMRSDSVGTSAMLGVVLPIPLVAPTARSSCRVMAKKITQFVLNKS